MLDDMHHALRRLELTVILERDHSEGCSAEAVDHEVKVSMEPTDVSRAHIGSFLTATRNKSSKMPSLNPSLNKSNTAPVASSSGCSTAEPPTRATFDAPIPMSNPAAMTTTGAVSASAHAHGAEVHNTSTANDPFNDNNLSDSTVATIEGGNTSSGSLPSQPQPMTANEPPVPPTNPVSASSFQPDTAPARSKRRTTTKKTKPL